MEVETPRFTGNSLKPEKSDLWKFQEDGGFLAENRVFVTLLRTPDYF